MIFQAEERDEDTEQGAGMVVYSLTLATISECRTTPTGAFAYAQYFRLSFSYLLEWNLASTF